VRTGKKVVGTMMIELNWHEELAICSIDEMRDKEIDATACFKSFRE